MCDQSSDFRFEVVQDWPAMPRGLTWGQIVQVIVDDTDHVLVFHRGKPGVAVFDIDGSHRGFWRDGPFQDIHAAWLGRDNDGEFLLVVDRDRNTIWRTTLEGEVVWEFRSTLFNRPTDAAIARNSDLYVTDGYGHALVHQFSDNREHIRSWGEPGNGPGQFQLPHGIWITDRDGQECIYVCDRENSRIQVFSTEGTYLTEITGVGRPTDIIVDREGIRYITELRPGFTLLDQHDRCIMQTNGVKRRSPGSFIAPHAAALDSEGSLYVVEVEDGARIQKFRRVS